MTSPSAGSRTVKVNPTRRVKSSAWRRRSERFSSSVMPPGGGHLLSVKPGVERTCSMLEVQAAWSASLCCGPSGSRRSSSVTSEVGATKSAGTKSSVLMAGTVPGEITTCTPVVPCRVDAARPTLLSSRRGGVRVDPVIGLDHEEALVLTHPVLIDQQSRPSRRERRGERRRLKQLDALSARLAELHAIDALLEQSRDVVNAGWIQGAWFSVASASGQRAV